ncbi:hypothetical protein BD410DRAFT_582580 [Rickenella mellea]|uniref:Uncharacterized protein n=1 Tax=Rickenella mellea TaxID=50990 RepID=A0A4Y7PPV1_9AGAM|nr:hypothetical protein BD410DRAFT_582580 [Rickenella mellea]
MWSNSFMNFQQCNEDTRDLTSPTPSLSKPSSPRSAQSSHSSPSTPSKSGGNTSANGGSISISITARSLRCVYFYYSQELQN